MTSFNDIMAFFWYLCRLSSSSSSSSSLLLLLLLLIRHTLDVTEKIVFWLVILVLAFSVFLKIWRKVHFCVVILLFFCCLCCRLHRWPLRPSSSIIIDDSYLIIEEKKNLILSFTFFPLSLLLLLLLFVCLLSIEDPMKDTKIWKMFKLSIIFFLFIHINSLWPDNVMARNVKWAIYIERDMNYWHTQTKKKFFFLFTINISYKSVNW